LDLGLSARTLALGGAAAAVAEGPDALLLNPAGLAWGSSWQFTSACDSRFSEASYGAISLAYSHVAVSIHVLDLGSMPEIGEFGSIVGSFGYRAYVAAAGFGVRASEIPFLSSIVQADSFALGASANLVGVDTLDPGDGRGATVDLGFLVEASPVFMSRFDITDFRFGTTVRSLFSSPMAFQNGHVENFARSVAIGVSLKWARSMLLAADVTSSGAISLGVEWMLVPSVTVRFGAKKDGTWMPSLGAALRFSTYSLDVASVLHPYLPPAIRASLSAHW
jgi:hypothetical protein